MVARRGHQRVRTEVVLDRSVKVERPLLPQLHHGDRRDRLGKGADPEHRVLSDRRVGRDIGEPVPVKGLEASIADHTHGQADSRSSD